MKQLIATLALTLSFAGASEAFSPMLPQGKLTYQLSEFKIAKGSMFLVGEASSGQIFLNKNARTMMLVVYPRFSCAPGRACAQMMPAPIFRLLKITSTGSPFCGGTIITAEDNRLPVDGDAMTVQVIDVNRDICGGRPSRLSVSVSVEERTNRSAQVIHSEMFGTPVSDF